MTVTDHFYGGKTLGAGRTIQDFGLCDLKGEYVYTAKLRGKGLLVVVFFSPQAAPSVRALKTVQEWTTGVPAGKWTAVGVAEGERDALKEFADEQGLTGLSIVIDYELYQTRTWGVSHLPSIYVIQGKTGRVLARVLGDDPQGLTAARQILEGEIAKMVAAEEAARKADEEKKAAEAAAKAAEAAKKPDQPAKA